MFGYHRREEGRTFTPNQKKVELKRRKRRRQIAKASRRAGHGIRRTQRHKR